MSSTATLSSSMTTSMSASASAVATDAKPAGLKVAGIILAVASGLLIGSSFVFKKKGLLRSQAGGVAGEGVAYLKSWLWWTGMIMMILGELCNFAAYAFVEAIVVTPLGALSVVICAILSSIFLDEKLTFFGWLGCGLAILGSTIIALNGPEEQTVGEIREFAKLFLAPGFLVFGSVLILASLVIIFYFAPKYGTKSMLWYIAVCSMIGGISVSVTTGLGAAIVTTAQGHNQFNYWFIYFLLVFVAITLVTEVYYLNKALALFNTAMVTPTYYVIFTFCTLVTTIVLFQGLKTTAARLITVIMGFFVICIGITILQMSKVDPANFNKLDRRSTMLLQASRNKTEDAEKSLSGIEDPGMDALRGSFGTVGSIIRARSARRMSMSQSFRGDSSIRSRRGTDSDPRKGIGHTLPGIGNMQRHQLYDAPVPRQDTGDGERISMVTQATYHASPHATPRTPTIKFDTREVVHQYPSPGRDASEATHEERQASHIITPRAAPPPDIQEEKEFETNSTFGSNSTRTMSPEGFRDPVFHTAPPSQTSFFHPPKKDPFDTTPATASGEIFPTSAGGLYGSSSESEEYTHSSPKVTRTLRHTSARRYPKTGGDEDREESVSLVQGQEDSSPVASHGGIRLVSSRNRF